MIRNQVRIALLLVATAAAQDHSQHQQSTPAQGQSQQQPARHDHAQKPAPAAQAQGLPAVPPLATWQGVTLAELERRALANNPTLRQAQAELQAARGRRLQAGLWPNPVVGYSGEEIRGGSGRGGAHGAFLEQSIVLGGKLAAGRSVFQHELRTAEIEAEEQRLRVVNGVRLAYYRVLAAQELLRVHRDYARLAADTVTTSRQLRNLGQLDESEVLQAEIEAQQAELAATRQDNQLRRAQATLAAVTGNAGAEIGSVAGRLDENLPALDEQQVLTRLLDQSPTVQIADAVSRRADALATQARSQRIPDLRLRAGLQQNRELLENGRPTGLQGFAEVGIQLPIFNRNQGNIEAARAELERARSDRERVRLVLAERASGLLRSYRNARAAAERYREQMLPRARRAFDLMLNRWGQMAASYPQVLLAQRTLLDLQTSYVSELEALWSNAITLEGMLLTDALEAPARAGEVDVPVREVNLPATRMELED